MTHRWEPETHADGDPAYQARHLDRNPRPKCTCQAVAHFHLTGCAITADLNQRLMLTPEEM